MNKPPIDDQKPGPIITVYCEGGTRKHPPHPRYSWAFEQDLDDSPQIREAQMAAGQTPQAHYWKPAGPKREGGKVVWRRYGLQRVLGQREKAEKANRLTAEQVHRSFWGTESSDILRLRWWFKCGRCPYELRLDEFGAVNALFDRVVARGDDCISLREIEDELQRQ